MPNYCRHASQKIKIKKDVVDVTQLLDSTTAAGLTVGFVSICVFYMATSNLACLGTLKLVPDLSSEHYYVPLTLDLIWQYRCKIRFVSSGNDLLTRK